MATVPPLVQLDHRGPQEAAVGQWGVMGVKNPFTGKPKTTKEQRFREAVDELRALGMPGSACDNLLRLVSTEGSDDELDTDADCVRMATCLPDDARRLVLDEFWKEAYYYHYNRGNAEKSRDNLKKLGSKLIALATATDKWWDFLRTDHLTGIVADAVRREEIRKALKDWATVVLDLVGVLDATIDVASADAQVDTSRTNLATATRISKTESDAVEWVRAQHSSEMAFLQEDIKQQKRHLDETKSYLELQETTLKALQQDIAEREASFAGAARRVIKADGEKKAAEEKAKEVKATAEAAKQAYLRKSPITPPAAARGVVGAEKAATRSEANETETEPNAGTLALAGALFENAAKASADSTSSSGSEFSGSESGDAAATGRQLRNVVGSAVQRA